MNIIIGICDSGEVKDTETLNYCFADI